MVRNGASILGLNGKSVELHAIAHAAGIAAFCFVSSMLDTLMWKSIRKLTSASPKIGAGKIDSDFQSHLPYPPPSTHMAMTSLALLSLKLLGICFYPP